MKNTFKLPSSANQKSLHLKDMEKSVSNADDPNHPSFEVTMDIKKERIRAHFERESKLVSAESLRMNKLIEAIEDGNDQP